MFDMKVILLLEDLSWSSDWVGEEVGYPESEVVGLYTQEREDGEYLYYIDMERSELLEFWIQEDEE